MTPFQQLRVWFRRAQPSQRVTTVAAMLIVASLFIWLVVPQDPDKGGVTAGPVGSGNSPVTEPSSPEDGSSADDRAAATSSDDDRTGAGASAGDGSDDVGRSDSATTPPTSGPVGDNSTAGGDDAATRCPSGTDQGASEDEVRAAITIINIAGALGNSTFGVPAPDVQERYWRIVTDALNAEGGFGCRQLVPEFYRVNPVNASEAQQRCLEIANSAPFLALDTGSLANVGASDCIPNHKIPMIARYLTRDQLDSYYPYYISPTGLLDDTIRNGVLAWKQQGHLSGAKGFEKLGVVHQSCTAGPLKIMRASLAEAGVPDGTIITYDLGCPPGRQNNPADVQQAVLTFKQRGVTHVSEINVADFSQFTRAAGQQKFRPQYLLASELLAFTMNPDSSSQPDADNFDGAINVVPSRNGEEYTPGIEPTGDTARCDGFFAEADQSPVYEQDLGYGGTVCSMLFLVEAILDGVTEIRRDALVPTLHGLGQLHLSFPYGPVDFAAVPQGTPFGRPFWRTTTYVAECRCVRVAEPSYQPSFPR